MNLPSLAIDNIAELLVKIMEFTQTRQKLLSRNLNNANDPGFVPKDYDVDEFSSLLNSALHEHIRSQRLVLRDTQNITFGTNGTFKVRPVVDEHAKNLLEENRNEYIELQTSKLLENSLNQRVAAELLRHRQGISPTFG